MPANRRLARRGGQGTFRSRLETDPRGAESLTRKSERDPKTYTQHAKGKTVTAVDVVLSRVREAPPGLGG